MGQEWEQQYLEDIEYLKSNELMFGHLFDKMGITDESKRKWLDVYAQLHIQNEQVSMVEGNSFPQLLPKSMTVHARTMPLEIVELHHDVKKKRAEELRRLTDGGLMDCKKCLSEHQWNVELARFNWEEWFKNHTKHCL